MASVRFAGSILLFNSGDSIEQYCHVFECKSNQSRKDGAVQSDDFGYGIAVDPAGDAYIVGQTTSANFPTLAAFRSTLNGANDAFLAKILLTSQPTLR